ncbi:MAG TPA: serine/threonine protein kinase, partial [Planctomycetaceae bacterium]|nr:serine/threonine protein kinase [Planctomycetaceae bacterium]
VVWDGESGQNIAWKIPVPGSGHSSPVIWQDRVFLTSCKEKTQERLLTCIDRHSGKT